MASDFLGSLAEYAVHVGVNLFAKSEERNQQFDPTTMADAVIESAIHQASEIVKHLGIASYVQPGGGLFGGIVAITSVELFSAVEVLTGVKLSAEQCSFDVGEACIRAIHALK